MRTTRATRHASSKRMVALTFAAWEAHESFRDRGTPGSAARWKTTSIPATARRHTSGSQRSPRRNSIAPSRPARFAASPVLRLSTTRTWWPRATSRSVTWEPIKPAPPVTRHRDARAARMESLVADGSGHPPFARVGDRWLEAGCKVDAARGNSRAALVVGNKSLQEREIRRASSAIHSRLARGVWPWCCGGAAYGRDATPVGVHERLADGAAWIGCSRGNIPRFANATAAL